MTMHINNDFQGLLYLSDFPPETKETDIARFFLEKGIKVLYYREGVSK